MLGCWASQAGAGVSPESSTATGHAQRGSFMAQKQDSALTVRLEAQYLPFVNCQQEAVTLAGHLSNPLKNIMKWLC